MTYALTDLCSNRIYSDIAGLKLNWFWIMVLSFFYLFLKVNESEFWVWVSWSEFLGLSYEKTNISKMKKDFSNFSFLSISWTIGHGHRLSMDNKFFLWFHGHCPCNMDIGHVTWTLAIRHGQFFQKIFLFKF